MPHSPDDRVSISIVSPHPGHAESHPRGVGILACGGWFVMPGERDLPSAYYRALEAGMGIVVPVRDHSGRLVISAGPASDTSPRFDDFIAERPVWPGHPPIMAVRICADGLARMVHRSLANLDGIVPYIFGMSVADTAGYLDGQIPLFVRQSEHEPQPAFYELAEGIWLDSFERDWFDERLIIQHLRAGKLVCVVSPDLHGRPHANLWTVLKSLQGKLEELSCRLQLCTHLPAEARAFFEA